MELERRLSDVAKKFRKTVKIALYMLMEGISKSKSLVDLHLMVKKGKVAGKTLGNLILYNYYSAFSTCRSTKDALFISPQDYEFSCSNTPVYAQIFKSHHHKKSSSDINVARNVFEMLKDQENSPFVALPGFGQSPMVRQLRITDSPFPLKEENDHRVDKAAEEFIRKFYKELKQQKRSPSPHNIWAR